MHSDQTFSLKGFTVWGIAALFFLYEFALRTAIGAFQTPLMGDLHLSNVQFSLLSTTLFLIFYGTMQIPVGFIVNHLGLKKSLFIGSSLCSLACIGFSFAENYPLAVGCRILMGAGASFGFVCLLIAVTEWMPHRYSALFIGLSQFIGTIGPMLTAGPLDSLSHNSNVSWRLVFLSFGLFGVLLSLLIICFVENNIEKSGSYTVLHRPANSRSSFSKLFSRLTPLWIAFFSAFVYLSIEYLTENEGRPFLQLKGFSPQFAAYMLSLSWLGYAIGCPLIGLISDVFERRKSPMVWAALCIVASLSGIIFAKSTFLLLLAFFCLGLGASGQSIGFAMMAETFKKPFVAIGFGLNNGMITLFAALNAPLIGSLLDQKNHLPTIENYQWAFSPLLLFGLLALCLSLFSIKETYCKSRVDFTYLTPKRMPLQKTRNL